MTGKDGGVGQALRLIWHVGSVADLTDGQLLERFAGGEGDAAELAFVALVERHGAMVLRVARGILADPDEAQDAFQATFLVLVAKARGLWARDSLGPWLHQVAHRTASSLRSSAARRRRLDRHVATGGVAVHRDETDDSAQIIHEEINRLPERFRVPVILCDLEGQTHEQAARALGWPVGTVKSRQARARDRLRAQLTRRGVTPGLILETTALARVGALPPQLVSSTTTAAIRSLTSRAIGSGAGAVLAQEVLQAMNFAGTCKVGALVLTLGVASGVGLIAQDSAPRPAAEVQHAAEPPVVAVRPGKLDSILIEQGSVEPTRLLDVINQVEGNRVIIRILPEGSRVTRGQLVAELDSAELKDQLANAKVIESQAESLFKQAKLTREVAEFAVKEYVEGVATQKLASLEAKVTTAKAAIDRAQTRLERTRMARRRLDVAINHRGGPETPADIVADLDIADQLENAELDIQARDLDLQTARGQQTLFEKFARLKNTKSLELDVEKTRLEATKREAAWRLEQTRVAKLDRQIDRCQLLAPDDGTLVYANDPRSAPGAPGTIEDGATVRERQILFRVFNPAGRMRVNTKVHESLVEQVQPDQAVRIKVPALPDEVFTGVVRSVAPMADPATFGSSGKKVYTTYVVFDQLAPQLRPGMVARVEIPIFELTDVLSVPNSAVVGVGGTDQVAVQTPTGAIEWRSVTLGRANDQAVEVKQGLQAGDRVLLDPITRLDDAARTRLAPKPPRAREPK